jgi:hypothetical protein
VFVQNLNDGFLQFFELKDKCALAKESFYATLWNVENAGHQDRTVFGDKD